MTNIRAEVSECRYLMRCGHFLLGFGATQTAGGGGNLERAAGDSKGSLYEI